MISFRWIWIICFNRFKFLAEKRKLDKWPHFFIYFLSSNCLWYLLLYLRNVKIHFKWGPPLWSILKISEFWRWKLWDRILSYSNMETYIKESKKPGFTFSIKLRTRFVWSHKRKKKQKYYVEHCIKGRKLH